jgi:hypothetical protein
MDNSPVEERRIADFSVPRQKGEISGTNGTARSPWGLGNPEVIRGENLIS